jgi:hypothetical protein
MISKLTKLELGNGSWLALLLYPDCSSEPCFFLQYMNTTGETTFLPAVYSPPFDGKDSYSAGVQ